MTTAVPGPPPRLRSVRAHSSGARNGAAAVCYVTAVAALAVVAFAHPGDDPGWANVAVAVATLPALVPLLPVVYVLGSATWNLTGADHGGPTWIVTVVYTALFTGAAVANVVVVRLLLHRLRGRRAPVPAHERQVAE
jgi:hypothetical protein